MTINQHHLLDIAKFYCFEQDSPEECNRKSIEMKNLLEQKNRQESISTVEERINIIASKTSRLLHHNSVMFFPSYRLSLNFSSNNFGPITSSEEMFFYISCITPVYTGFVSKFVSEQLNNYNSTVLPYPSVLIAQPGNERYHVFNENVEHIGELWSGYQFVDLRQTIFASFPAQNVTYCTETPTLFDVLFGNIGPRSSFSVIKSLKI